jgi:hypothetical protein
MASPQESGAEQCPTPGGQSHAVQASAGVWKNAVLDHPHRMRQPNEGRPYHACGARLPPCMDRRRNLWVMSHLMTALGGRNGSNLSRQTFGTQGMALPGGRVADGLVVTPAHSKLSAIRTSS